MIGFFVCTFFRHTYMIQTVHIVGLSQQHEIEAAFEHIVHHPIGPDLNAECLTHLRTSHFQRVHRETTQQLL